jgi:hypothetical protein
MSVGLEVSLEKERETAMEATYFFYVREGCGGLAVSNATGRAGRVVISKTTGDVKLLESCPDDFGGGVLFSRAVAALSRHWKVGEYPNATSWAG